MHTHYTIQSKANIVGIQYPMQRVRVRVWVCGVRVHVRVRVQIERTSTRSTRSNININIDEDACQVLRQTDRTEDGIKPYTKQE